MHLECSCVEYGADRIGGTDYCKGGLCISATDHPGGPIITADYLSRDRPSGRPRGLGCHYFVATNTSHVYLKASSFN